MESLNQSTWKNLFELRLLGFPESCTGTSINSPAEDRLFLISDGGASVNFFSPLLFIKVISAVMFWFVLAQQVSKASPHICPAELWVRCRVCYPCQFFYLFLSTDSDTARGEDAQLLLLFVVCLTSQQQASVSQGRICSDNFTCCHTEIEVKMHRVVSLLKAVHGSMPVRAAHR